MAMNVGRRTVLKGLGAAATAGVFAPHVARAQTKAVNFTLPWVAEGSNLYCFVAKEKGFWAEHDLDVTISRGYGSTAAAQAIGAGQFDFGCAAATAGLQQAMKGLPVVQITSCGYDATMGVCTLADSGITEPSGLDGTKMGATTTSGEFPFLPAFAERAGFDWDSIEVIQVDPAVRQRVLVERQVQSICGFAISFLPVFLANNVKTRFFLFNHYGMKFYNNSLMTQADRIESDPETCAAMADGLQKAMKFVLLNPEESLSLFFKAVPEAGLSATGRQQVEAGMGIFSQSLVQEPLKTNAIGYSNPDDFESMIELVYSTLSAEGDTRPTVEAVLDSQYVGDVSLTADEFQTAWDSCATYREMLGG
ncbi:ABC transporter substrate-binding protein [Acuticoccus mangrovi]|uniref:Thiamine pyrimidine synthase n=1 Tax=Acuticoccus mangrovi TaxID=2796142 RepID=A0A934MKP0_9HYPH|nr:ABC transporter substrate-binding protein [Acuticoccus mangrovi]MBJ3775634.1 ABC transporter substrate-binding protein [Acuticoccus mangrovi]